MARSASGADAEAIGRRSGTPIAVKAIAATTARVARERAVPTGKPEAT